MSSKHLFILLEIVKSNGDTRRLIREGIDYKEIAELTNEALNQALIEFSENSLMLTVKGEILLLKLSPEHKQRDKDIWIEKENKSKIPKLEKDFIFLPNQNELHF